MVAKLVLIISMLVIGASTLLSAAHQSIEYRRVDDMYLEVLETERN